MLKLAVVMFAVLSPVFSLLAEVALRVVSALL